MSTETIQEMHRILELQKSCNIKDGAPDISVRADRLDRVVAMVTKYDKKIIETVSQDFGNRDPMMSGVTEVQSVIGPMQHAKKNLKKWMKTEKRKAAIAPLGSALSLLGAKAEIRYQPKGVVGAISPWNFPLNLALAPLAGILSAGNRVMLKPSELTPASSDLTKLMIEEYFDESEIGVFIGDPEVGAAFSGLAFDHLIFTGGTAIAKHVMKAASENLVPLTLELGGKSPVVVGKSSKIKDTASRVMQGKTMNAGQICLAPDYLLVHESVKEKLLLNLKTVSLKQFGGDNGSSKESKDYSRIVNNKHYSRLNGLIKKSTLEGAQLFMGGDSDSESNYIAPTILTDIDNNSPIMSEEIFGPILPVITFKELKEATDFINKQPKPLGLYIFSKKSKNIDFILDNTSAGGTCINDTILHYMHLNLPFGGINTSGFGLSLIHI